ncbi:hypothetical protein GN956_G2740 [Arapaima gigas]
MGEQWLLLLPCVKEPELVENIHSCKGRAGPLAAQEAPRQERSPLGDGDRSSCAGLFSLKDLLPPSRVPGRDCHGSPVLRGRNNTPKPTRVGLLKCHRAPGSADRQTGTRWKRLSARMMDFNLSGSQAN